MPQKDYFSQFEQVDEPDYFSQFETITPVSSPVVNESNIPNESFRNTFTGPIQPESTKGPWWNPIEQREGSSFQPRQDTMPVSISDDWIANQASKLPRSLQFAGGFLGSIGNQVAEFASDPINYLGAKTIAKSGGKLENIAESAISTKNIPTEIEHIAKVKPKYRVNLDGTFTEIKPNTSFDTEILPSGTQDRLRERNIPSEGMSIDEANRILGREPDPPVGGISERRNNELMEKFGGLQKTPIPDIEQPGLGKLTATEGRSHVSDPNALSRMQAMSDEEFLTSVSRPTALSETPIKPGFANLDRQATEDIFKQGPFNQRGKFGSSQIPEVIPEPISTIPKIESPPLPPSKIPPKIPQERIPSEMRKINDSAKLANESQKEGLYKQASGFLRTMLTTLDLSAPGRQGKGLITHPEFWTSFDDMFKSWGSKRAYDTVQQSIVDDASGLFKPEINVMTGEVGKSIAEKAGLDLTDLVKHKEEVFRSNIAEKYIPGVARSQRAYTAFLNKARADVFKKLVEQTKTDGFGSDMDRISKIAQSINVSTGRGSFGKLENMTLNTTTKQMEASKAMQILNEVFFAPKLAASRVQMYTRVLNPKTYINADPVLRKEALRSLFGIVGTAGIVGELGRLAGAEVSNDSRSSDFRKIKIGNTRIDNLAGLQQYGVAAARLLSGQSTSSVSGKTSDLTNPKFGGQTRSDIVQNFITNKLAPIPSFIWAWMNTKEFDGTPFEVKQAILNRTVPIVMQDMYELYQEDPSLLPLGILPMMGEGIQTYGR